VRQMPAPGFVDIRDSTSPDQDSTDPLVVGGDLMTTDKCGVSFWVSEPARNQPSMSRFEDQRPQPQLIVGC
jgi:hypothetical protein